MDRCWLKGAAGDAIHAVLCAAGYNLRWLMRAVVRLSLKGFFIRLFISVFITWLADASQVLRSYRGQIGRKNLSMA